MGQNSFTEFQPTGPAGPPGGTNAVPTGAYSVVTAGADPSGVADSTAAISSAIDTVLNNQSTYKTVYFPTGIYKMNNQVQKLNILANVTLNLQGGNNVLIDATGSTDQSIFDLEGNGNVASTTLGVAVTQGASTITLTAGGVAALGLVAGDKMMLTTQPYVDARTVTASWPSASTAITVTGGSPTNLVNGTLIGTGQFSSFPIGTTISSGGGTVNIVASLASFAGSAGSGNLFINDPLVLFNVNRNGYYRGEIVEVPLATENAVIAGQVVPIKRPAYDNYQIASTTVFKIAVPTITINGLNFKRNGNNGIFGYLIRYANASVIGCSGQGARDRLFYLEYCYGGLVKDNFGTDFWFSGTGSSYGIIISSCQDLVIRDNRMFGGRHGITSGGFWPVRNCQYLNNTLENVDTSAPCFDFHENAERCLIQGNTFNNGWGIACPNVMVKDNNLFPSPADKVSLCGPADYLVFTGNVINSASGLPGLVISYREPTQAGQGYVTKLLDISNNVVRSGTFGILIQPETLNNFNGTIDHLKMDGNDVRTNGAAQALNFSLATTASIKVNKMTMNGGRYDAQYDAIQIAVDPASGVWRASNTQFILGRSTGQPIQGTVGQGFIDAYFDQCYFGENANGTDNRGNSLYGTGRVVYDKCEFDFANGATFGRNGGVNHTNGSTSVVIIDPKYSGTVLGIPVVPAGSNLAEIRYTGALTVAGDWVLSGWGASAVATVTGNSYSGTLTITTNAADSPSANPTATLTVKERGFGIPPQAVAVYDNTSTGPTASPGLATITVNAANPTAGGVNTNSVSKMIIKYIGTPTALTALTYKFQYRLNGG